MTKSLGLQLYEERLKDLRKECDEQVANGELSEDDAAFRYDMVKDEILESIPDELFMQYNNPTMNTVYILIHYVIRNELIAHFAGIIGVYSTEDKAKEAIPSKYNSEKHKYEIHPMVVDAIPPHTYL